MRSTLLLILVVISFSASAQWYRIDLKLKKRQPHPAAIERVTDHSIARLPAAKLFNPSKVYLVSFNRSDYSYDAAESIVMKTAQHNMRFRIYNDASYNFSDLARLYIQQNRVSEAKWYLLQSNLISREQNDDKHTISNLIDLATIKINNGDYVMAHDDLTEAHDLASARGLTNDVAEIDNMLIYIRQNKLPTVKTALIYSADAQNSGRSE